MYATIEPRLIALLNDEPSEAYTASHSLELPPLNRPSIFTADGRPLLLGPDAGTPNGKPAPIPNAQLGPQHAVTLTPPIDDGEKERSEQKQPSEKATTDRALGSSSPQSLRKILDDDTGGAASIPSKKRLIVENSKDDFVQLPQPLKKHKTAKQVVPPIIIGLFEPPPQAALFPPIASSSFHDSHGRNSLNIVSTSVKEVEEPSKCTLPKEIEKKTVATKSSKKRKDVRVRKKWTEEETDNLLLGVYKHGVGNWTDILEDSDFLFNERSGADLKDRFRTCCPAELRENDRNGKGFKQAELTSGQSTLQGKSKSSLMSENILIDDDDLPANPNSVEGSSSKAKKSRAHRRKMADLAQLGIAGPFRKSHRRERRPFTEQEDRAILDGYNLHGPAWTRIQRDPRFHLQTRQPTDLRDRFRNKYPEKFRSEDKGDASSKEHVGTQFEQQPPHVRPIAKDREHSDPDPVANGLQSAIPPVQPVKTSGERRRDRIENENGESATKHPSSSLQSFPSREGLRIQEIISTEDDSSKGMPLQPQTSLYHFKDNFNTFSDPPAMESSEGLAFSQSFDWGGSMTAPFTSNMGEMDISRLLLDETWIDNASSGKEKQSLAEISSIISSGPDNSNVPAFDNMLGDAERIDDLQEHPFG
ncbi:Telobox protein [Lachnellula occidentalis]|uniref:Telobox protein n=1 Tax=Lachnellula occidentalis TaxID=215460 RepID=A0A8H8S530_9HELO|nr:Telobox protein [Lachnellula occidentalis]